MDGFLNINKPSGMTSFGVVARVRRLTGEKRACTPKCVPARNHASVEAGVTARRRVGHAGTLDPLATGVLPVCLGQATRLTEYLGDITKTYRAEIEFGITTDTYDAEGKVMQRADASAITRGVIEAALPAFTGQVIQVPPAFSAIKIKGRKAYQLARAGTPVTPTARPVRIDCITVLDWQPPVVTLEVDCGRGTYIRSLANDLGVTLGCGAYLKSLVRLKDGIFDIKNAVTLEQLEEAVNAGYWESLLYPLDSVLERWPAAVLGEETARQVRNGSLVSLGLEPAGDFSRAYTQDGCFMSVLKYDRTTSLWHPEKVFGAAGCPGEGTCPAGGHPCQQAAESISHPEQCETGSESVPPD